MRVTPRKYYLPTLGILFGLVVTGCGNSTDSEVNQTTPGDISGNGASGSAVTAAEPPLKKFGLLECPSGGAVISTVSSKEPGGFDGPEAAKTPEGALEIRRADARKAKSGSPRNQLGERAYQRSSSSTESTGRVHFVAKRDEGSVVSVITVKQGGKSKSWLPVEDHACAPLPATIKPAPGTVDPDDGSPEQR